MKKRTLIISIISVVLIAAAAFFGVSGAMAKSGDAGNTVSIEEAREIALAKVPGADDIRISYDKDDRQYEGEIIFEGKEYEFEVSARTGKIVSWKVEAAESKPVEAKFISIEEAEKIALAKVPGATDISIYLDREDAQYEGEIIFEGKEYDFEIDAATGKILDWDVDFIQNANTTAGDESGYIGLEEAKKIALAKVPGATDISIYLDREDAQYEGEVRYNGKEYDFEIDAKTGKIIDWDIDKLDNDNGYNEKPAASPTSGTGAENGYISLEEAKKIALAKVPGATDIRIKLDREDGQYEGEIIFEGKEYDFEINAKTGKIVDWEVENVKSSAPASTKKPEATQKPAGEGYISIEEAKKIALKRVPGATDIRIKLDREDGQYEGEIHYQGKEYEFEINAKTGKVVEWDVEVDDD